MWLPLSTAILPHLPSFTSQHSSPGSLSPSHFPSIHSTASPYIHPAKQTGRQRHKRPNTGRGPSPVGPLNAECLKITTWQLASHRRFQRKSHISFQNGPQCLLRLSAISFFCFFQHSLLPMSLLPPPPPHHHHHHHMHMHTHMCTQRPLKAICQAKVK